MRRESRSEVELLANAVTNLDDTDECTTACQLARCGDGRQFAARRLACTFGRSSSRPRRLRSGCCRSRCAGRQGESGTEAKAYTQGESTGAGEAAPVGVDDPHRAALGDGFGARGELEVDAEPPRAAIVRDHISIVTGLEVPGAGAGATPAGGKTNPHHGNIMKPVLTGWRSTNEDPVARRWVRERLRRA